MAVETITRMKIIMAQREYSALIRAADISLRTPDAEARLIIRNELVRRGLLTAEDLIQEIQHVK